MIKIKEAKGIIKLYLKIFKAKAVYTPWNTIYFLDKKMIKERKIIKHELKHFEQRKREGIIKFAVKYTYYLIKYGYRNNPYEIEARKAMGIYDSKQLKKYGAYLKKKY